MEMEAQRVKQNTQQIIAEAGLLKKNIAKAAERPATLPRSRRASAEDPRKGITARHDFSRSLNFKIEIRKYQRVPPLSPTSGSRTKWPTRKRDIASHSVSLREGTGYQLAFPRIITQPSLTQTHLFSQIILKQLLAPHVGANSLCGLALGHVTRKAPPFRVSHQNFR
jgi:hypothetical protein